MWQIECKKDGKFLGYVSNQPGDPPGRFLRLSEFTAIENAEFLQRVSSTGLTYRAVPYEEE